MVDPEGHVRVGSLQREAGKTTRLQTKGEMSCAHLGKWKSRTPERKVKMSGCSVSRWLTFSNSGDFWGGLYFLLVLKDSLNFSNTSSLLSSLFFHFSDFRKFISNKQMATDWIFMSPKFILLNLIPPSEGIWRWGLQETINSWRQILQE